MDIESLTCGCDSAELGRSRIVHADCFEWLEGVPRESVHAIVTDPPYGLKEFDDRQLEKRSAGKGGIWRMPPRFDGNVRAPLPRFTALDEKDRSRLTAFFAEWARLCVGALRPGGNAFVATNAFVSQLLYGALVAGGLEFRGQIIRVVRTLRGGDRPKNAEREFPGVSTMPRGCYEPWGLFRKPLRPKLTIGGHLRKYRTGGMRRFANGNPFEDLILSERTPPREREIANHPSVKPQSFMRRIVYASLPLGEGVVVDPFMGSGSTVAAAEALGIQAIGIERNREYFSLAEKSVPALAAMEVPSIDAMVGRRRQQSLPYEDELFGEAP